MRVHNMKAILSSSTKRIRFNGIFLTLTFLGAAPVSAEGVAHTLECNLVDHARILHSQKEKSPEFGKANLGHQIGPGEHTVLSIRRFDDLDLVPDSQNFSKTTVELEKFPLGVASGKSIQLSVLFSFHSEGNIGFIPSGAYEWASNPLRAITIRREAGGLMLQLSANFSAKNASSGRVKSLHIDVDCPLCRIRLEDLSYWQGREGTNWNSFYPVTAEIR